jgi:hypothetical protein
MRAAGETEMAQENVQNWLQLDEENIGIRLLVFL